MNKTYQHLQQSVEGIRRQPFLTKIYVSGNVTFLSLVRGIKNGFSLSIFLASALVINPDATW